MKSSIQSGDNGFWKNQFNSLLTAVIFSVLYVIANLRFGVNLPEIVLIVIIPAAFGLLASIFWAKQEGYSTVKKIGASILGAYLIYRYLDVEIADGELWRRAATILTLVYSALRVIYLLRNRPAPQQ